MAVKRLDATPFVPRDGDLATMRTAVNECRGCPLYAHATQGVFGEGPIGAQLMLVGEQPGDQEDLQGRPFVGPAGRLLDRALADAGVDRSRVFVTNAVKHFKFDQRGKRRIHKKPSTGETYACHPWLDAEIDRVHPRVIVCLGATALLSVVGPQAKVMESRGVWLQANHGGRGDPVIVTRHPSALLRMTDHEERERAYQELVEDLKLAAKGPKGKTKAAGRSGR
jgi:uracil-DNA glycosylase family protein